jgi:hypothetical protein
MRSKPGGNSLRKLFASFAPDLTVKTLRDHRREILLAIVEDLEDSQSHEEQSEESEGRGVLPCYSQ